MKMKKLVTIIVAFVMVVSCIACLAACQKKTYEIAVVTDVGQLMDGGFNQGTYEVPKRTQRQTTRPISTISPLTAPTRRTTTVSKP